MYCEGKSCLNEIEENYEECDYCGIQLCDECSFNYVGFCEECYELLRKEKTEEEKELWKAFWASRF